MCTFRHNKLIKLFICLAIAFAAGIIAYPIQGPDGFFPQLKIICSIAIGISAFIAAAFFYEGRLSPLWVKIALERSGITNKVGETPTYLRVKRDKDNDVGFVIVLDARGTPRSVFEDRKSCLEASLNIYIDRIEQRSPRTIEIYAVPAKYGLPDFIAWDDSFFSSEEMVITLGKSVGKLVRINMQRIPHMLIGGSTGSGKSFLFRSIVYQALKHNCSVHLADFKGGLDLPRSWKTQCDFNTDKLSFLHMLREEVGELIARKCELERAECANIYEYNKRYGMTYRHIIIACDEIGEILDTTGVDKEEKAIINEISGLLATIARQGRAFGMHLVLATQRPSADILRGEIKNNIDCRICGRADNVLSQIILDSTVAADTIPKNAQGRFVMHDGKVFQGFWHDESDFEEGFCD